MASIASIGQFIFHTFEWPKSLSLYKQDVDVIESPGVDNADFRMLGFHGQPFTVETESNFLNEHFAWNALIGSSNSYKALIETVPQTLIYFATNFTDRQWKVKVLDVHGGALGLPVVRRVGGIVGGAFPNTHQIILSATWTLKWVKV